MKICYVCLREKEDSNFSKDGRDKSGLRSECKDCVSVYNKKYRSGIKFNTPLYERVKESMRKANRQYQKKNPEKSNARQRIYQLVKKNKIKKLSCEICGNKDSEGHHPDYSRPLEVKWLCPRHHKAEHIKLESFKK